MKRIKMLWIILIPIICLLQSPTIARPNPPVALLVNGSGTLAFSKDGNKWSPINRNKFLFSGDFVKTGHDGTCKLLFHDSHYAKYIENNSQAIVKEGSLELLAGNATESNKKAFNLLDNLRRKFAVIHRYTTVQRSQSNKTNKFSLPELLAISIKYPTLAWENMGDQYRYQLIFQGKSYSIPESDQKIIRYNLTRFKPGKHKYTVCVMDQEKEVLRRSATVDCLSAKESSQIDSQEENIRQISDQGFLLGSFMDDQGLKVPALDYYLRYFENGNYDSDVYPFLLKVYDDLGMKRIARKERTAFNQQRQ